MLLFFSLSFCWKYKEEGRQPTRNWSHTANCSRMSKGSASVTGYKPLLFTYSKKVSFQPRILLSGTAFVTSDVFKRDARRRTGQRARPGRAAEGGRMRCRGDAVPAAAVPAAVPGPAAARCPRAGGGPGAVPPARRRARRSALWRRAGAARAAPAGSARPAPAADPCPAPRDNPALTGRPAGHGPRCRNTPREGLAQRVCKGWWWHSRASLFSKAVLWPKSPPVPEGLSQSLPYLQEARLIDFLSMAMNFPSL